MEKQEALKHLREVFKWFQGQTQESLKTLLPEITETEDDKFKQLIRLVLIATEDDQRAFYSTHGTTRKECTDWLENRAVRDEKNVRKYIASLAFNLHAETDLPYGECVRFAIQLGEDLLGVADGTVESGISDEDLEDFENEKCVRLAAAEMEATKDKEHAEKFLKSAGIMDKDGGLAEPYQNDIELGLDRALHIVEAARGKLDGYDTDDGIYECDHAIQVLSDFLDSKVWKPIKWNEEDENMLWTVINSLSDVTRGEERNWLAERFRYLVPEPREWDSNVLPENADDKTVNEKLISLVHWSGTPWSTKDKDQFVSYLEKLGSEKYVPCDGQCKNCACFQSGLYFQQEKKLEEEQKPAEWSYPYGKNETVDRLVSLAECLEMDGDCRFNGYTGTECGKFLRELARKQVECKHAELSEDERTRNEIIAFIEQAIHRGGGTPIPKEKEDKWLAYLEKQEQKPTATINGEPIPTENHSVDIPLAGWSKEDKAMLNNLIWAVHMKSISPLDEIDDRGKYERYEKFLTSLPERFGLKPKPEWGREDENKIERLAFLVSVAEEKEMISPSEGVDLRNFIKSLRPQPKQEWSEHDREMKLKILKYLSTRCSVVEFEEVEDWLNCLRIPWRPSFAQIEAVLNTLHPDDPYYPELSGLLRDLKRIYYGSTE